MKTIRIKKLDTAARLPERAHPSDAGLDLFGLNRRTLMPGETARLKTGIAIQIDEGYVGIIKDRSWLSALGVACSGGVIDAGYRGEISIVLTNHDRDPILLKAGYKIAQLLIVPIVTPSVVEVSELSEGERGDKGFGSTGK